MVRLQFFGLFTVLFLPFLLPGINPTPSEIKKWQSQALRVTIIRDHFGIPHIYGQSDADAVFGLLYAQCEDDFKRVELNYIEKLGRLSEINGQRDMYNDLYLKLIIDSADAVRDFNHSPTWMKKLLHAFADGINYYLFTHPSVQPKLIQRFEPWYPLLWTDGSIGAINTAEINEDDVKAFYSGTPVQSAVIKPDKELSGSNGFAIAPSRSASGHALLYINPHVTFYFRPEVHLVSEEGLNVYGAVTWGQFFIYQGFNEHCGWMHTSSNVDVADVYKETIVHKGKRKFYEYNNQLKPLKTKNITIRYKDGSSISSRSFETYVTHHGPVMAMREGQWASVRSNNRSLDGLKQSWLRTKASGWMDYLKTMELKNNISNNTVYADDQGHIAYWHGNFIPLRDANTDWSKPVDGKTKANEWKGLHTIDQSVHSYDPPNGWLQNCNSTPFTAAGKYSPDKTKFPAYMAPDGENFRGINAVRVLEREPRFTLDKLIQAGYDTYLPAFELLIPSLIKAFDNYSHNGDNKYDNLEPSIQLLRTWDFHAGASSVATTLAVDWAQRLSGDIQKIYVDAGEADQVAKTKQFAADATEDQLLAPFAATLEYLQSTFGTWRLPWGDINRFQRLSGDVVQSPDDQKPSLPVGFASATWGMLPSYNSRKFDGTQKRYGVSGNSFVCAVEFGKKIKAKSVLAGGQSGDPLSPHFKDQSEMYTKGIFKEVLFYREDVEKHIEKKYRPGE